MLQRSLGNRMNNRSVIIGMVINVTNSEEKEKEEQQQQEEEEEDVENEDVR